jgi:YaiO family outer membrane protein
MKNFFYLFVIVQFYSTTAASQNINTDSLLKEGLKSFRQQEYQIAIRQGLLGVEIAPEYMDFHMLLGRSFRKIGTLESAQIYFDHVIATTPLYKDAFINSIQLSNITGNHKNALKTAEQAIEKFKDEKEFELLKLKTLKLNNEHQTLVDYQIELVNKYPDDLRLQESLRAEKSKFISDRIGLDHSYSIFNREGIGPWNLTGLQFIRERRKTTFIGRLNYIDRQSNGRSIKSGFQFELGAYIKTGSKGTSISNIAYSRDSIFPKTTMSYFYLHNFDSGWELTGGVRYIKPNSNNHIYASVIGIGKYLGSSWLNLTSYLFFENGENYVAIDGRYRYYFNTKYDYFSLFTGFGNSLDERINLTTFADQGSLKSFRAGIAFNKIIRNKVILGLKFIGNRQEYTKIKRQNQFDLYLSIQYKL